jgi:hypothetical protein
MKVLKFSRHFVDQWVLRKGTFPTLEEVNTIIQDSLLIMKQQLLYHRKNNGAMVEHKELSHYWNHGAAVILLVDDLAGVVVTCLTPDMVSKFVGGSRMSDVGCRKIEGKGKRNGCGTNGTADAERIAQLLNG